ncbi:rifamycin polyketide synthase [Amycolatopsis mediterranei S699]|uniref:6-deoxyerythronolide-B synthase n=2 Tax=Amycolatopsis mediterranei TaxID=33910 RepID=A0A0H3CVW3_AMYMU|nr:type I polyketide synthase [Amycolatopsis mediterranei]ADJ42438.1 rifamycin polyketide synthase [Amycolatopsis mediterranei U32]AEK39124.1 rifamycin polyketide synthase [Amycolatopsis mediterranei S699]AFO74152.1 rifamycin polyketide synthase [Amycolatopsis mediterranei S699]AGT81281.1 rifamycin polyketide synthase [Amycolatopsis mediterranei RB]KDO09653.1 beta-ketoacyl synthase [Amycolatopsis mediterranei]
MSAPNEQIVDALRASLKENVRLQQENSALAAAAAEPVAIVSMACRYAGGIRGPEDFWRVVSEGADVYTGFPEDRGWDVEGLYHPDPDNPGTTYVREGAFLQDAAQFDAGFFGISPREALAMDPQQRQLLEVSWETLERAGIDPHSVRGSDIGVYAGVVHQDYAPDLSGFEGFMSLERALGTAGGVASGRVAYTLGLEGPAVTVDTMCSSSLVAIHLAAQALRRGECSMALAGGSTVMATPGGFVGFARQRALAFDGRCKSYAAAADGSGWAEGVGVLLLERLSVARERGHQVLAVIRGSAVNQDGASNGLTAPNGPAQQRVIRKALASAGLTPSDVDTVEGHGTGTVLGDPIEVQALLATYGQGRDPQQPLWLGSVKSVVGHTQAASGVAGVIKMVQSLRHGQLPATQHVDAPTPQVDWSAGAIELLAEGREWPRNGHPRRGGISSFGASGTNAHMILEEAPEDEPVTEAPAPTGVVPLVVSAATAASLAAQAGRLAEVGDVSLADVAGTLVSGRAMLSERAVVVAGSHEEAVTGLRALARGESAPGLLSGRGSGVPGKVVWVFPGQGTQWAGMGRELLDSSEVFAARIAECETALGRWVDWSLTDVLRGEADLLDRVDVVQPASFAVMVGLAAVWASLGVEPEAVVGHSQGEIAAACVSGALSLEDAAKVVALRSQAIAASLAGRGGMASVALSEEDATARLEPWAGRVEVAAVNGPTSVVIAGDAEALDEALDALDDQGVRIRRVAVDYASHTRHVEAARDALAEMLGGIRAQAPEVPFYSTVTGGWVEDAGVLDGGYWYRNLRRQVRFGPAVAELIEQGHRVFVEVSAHPVLVQPINELVDDTEAVVTGTLRREDGGLRRLLASAAELFVRGVTVDWSGVLPPSRRVELPTYAFDHQHYWLQMGGSATDAVSLGLAGADHPLLGAVVPLPQSDGLVFTSRLSLKSHPWLAGHAIGGVVLIPGTVYVDLALRAGDELGFGVLEELVIEAPLVLGERGGVRVQVAVSGPNETGSRAVDVFSMREDGDEWTRHATGLLGASTSREPSRFDFAAWPPAGAEPIDVENFYTDLTERGYAYSGAFQGMRAVWRRGDEVFAEVALPDDHREDAGKFGLHPALLDAALHTNAFANPDDDRSVLPFAWNGLVLHAVGASALRVRVAPGGPDALTFQAADETGGLVVTMDSLVSREVSAAQLETAAGEERDSLFQVDWIEVPATETAATEHAEVLEAFGEAAPLELTSRVLEAVQSWLADAADEARLVVVTRGAVREVTDPAGAAVWGLVRAAQAENPGRIILVDTDGDVPLGAVLASGEPQLAVRGNAFSVPRLARATGEVPEAPAVFSPEGTVLLTGGTGSLGGLVAKHLVARHGVRRLVLASRRGVAAEDLVTELTEQGATVSVVACDVSDRDQVAALLAEHRPTGIVHLAGLLDDGVIGALNRERLAGVFAPKVDAVQHLDELTRDLGLDAFVVFSSAAALMGSAGQGNYAAANAFLDGLMAGRRAAGLPGVSLAWGLWEQADGLTANLSATDQARMSRGGVLPMTPAEALDIFDIGLAAEQALLVPIKLDLRTLRGQATAGGEVPHLLRGLVRASRRVTRTAAASGGGGLVHKLAGRPAEEQEAVLLGIVQAEAAAVLGFNAPELAQGTRGFSDLGFDSLTAVELRNRLSAATGVKLPATLVFDYPTPVALARHLREELGETVAGAPATPVTTVADAGEPIAIVGMACRLPGGVMSPDDLWRMVAEGRDGMSPFPGDRGWDLDGLFDSDPERPGTAYIRQGGFLHEAALFDPGFFGISPREALAMDPQQRLLLEASWEALERAGIDPTKARGDAVGVFSGVSIHDYLESLSNMPAELEGFVTTATAGSVASGRVSYTFGFEGPAVTVDTACSSSLVAIHLAAQALRQGECTMALAGGVAVMGSPIGVIGMSRQRGMAEDGRVKAFADGADGTVLSEGVGIVVLERLSVARERGHRVLAVLRGSAVNQDGASNGLTAPNGPSQQRVIRSALAGAGLQPSEVDVVEAHGTGTALGDPIEAQALLATYGKSRETPLWLGSLKSNIGHTQAAAGVAAVIKMVQALRHDTLPPTLHVQEPTKQVDWSAGAVELLTEGREWARNGHPRRAGVSSFGISGTNAHLILEEAPADDTAEADVPDAVVPVVISARSTGSLAGQAGRLAAFLDGDVPLTRVAGALLSTRATLTDRAVVVAGSAEEARAGLTALARGESASGLVTGTAGMPGKTVWVFPGQGTQWAGMGRELLEASPVFAERIEECAAALQPWIDWSLLDVLRGEGELDRVDVLQPACFAVMVGLAAVWASVGVVPDAVLGHSQGEIAAACVSGALSLEDAAKVVALRSQAIAAELSGRGGMASIQLSHDEVAARLAPWAGRVEIAAVNGPASVVIAGDAEALTEAVEVLGGRRVAVDYASHTRHVEDIQDTLAETLAGIDAQAPVVPFYSTVAGEWITDAGVVDGGYWYRNLRNQVGFGPAVAELIEQGHGVFVEVSAHPVLVQPISELTDAVVTGTLRRDDGGVRRLLTSMAELFVRGVPVDWATMAPPARVELPTYAFDHQHFWLSPPAVADAPALGLAGADHPLLGAVLPLPQSDGLVFTSRLSVRTHPWLADGVPAAALVELAVRAGDEAGCPVLADLTVEKLLVLPESGGLRVQVIVSGERTVEVYSQLEGAEDWIRNATGHLSATAPAHEAFDFTAWPPAGAQQVDGLWRRGDEIFAEVALPEELDAGAFGIHPFLLDAAVQPVLADDEQPAEWRSLVLHAAGASALRVRLVPGGALQAADETGGLVLTADSVAGRELSAGKTRAGSLYRVDWTEVSIADSAVPANIEVVEAFGEEPLELTGRVLEAVQTWLVTAADDARLVVVTRGAVREVTDPAGAAVWGLVRAAQAENPGRIFLIDTDGEIPALTGDEPEIAVRGGKFFVPRITRAEPSGAAVFRPDGTVLISGAGALGGLVARRLVERHGVRKLVLASRRGRDADGVADLVADLAADVSVVACDVSDRAQVAALLDEHRPTAVVHTAGVIDAGVIETLDRDRLATVFAPKVDAVRHLDELTRDRDLDAFVVYSSVSAVFMGAGSGSYAAANAFLDGLMANRRAAGLPGLSLAWGLWDQSTGMAAGTDEATRARMSRRGGLQIMTQAEGMDLFDAALSSAESLLVPAKLDLRGVRADAAAGGVVPHMLRGLVRAGRAQARAASTVDNGLAGRLAGLAPADQLTLLLDLVRAQVAAVLGHADASAVRVDTAFKDAGFDSLTAVELRNRMRTATGLKLPATLVFDYPNPQALARHLRDELGGAAQTPVTTAAAKADLDEPIAIVGMACRLPGGVAGPEDLWRLVAEGRDAVSSFPTDRGWDTDSLYDPDPARPGKTYTRHGGFLHEAGLFDAGFFGISPREAVAMDPQQRLLLEASWEAMEDAGVDPLSLKGNDVGVFTGMFGQGYVAPGDSVVTPELEGFAGTGGSSSVASGRVSYVFGFEGPAVTIDSACSSSLVAMHLAAQSLRQGECSMALAGGATVMANPGAFVEFSRQRGLAVDGRCKAFAAAADGTGWAEGVGVVILERLSVARERGHRILAVLRGSAVNQDGASNGLTAPNGPSQQRVIRRALVSAGLAPSDVDVVEAHGTGTTLGDPIEAQALLATYGKDRESPLWLGSLKSNIGHAQAAAGVAGVIKMVQALRHEVLPPTLHVDRPTPEVDWSAGAVELLTEAREWPRNGRPRRAGVSAFGVSGTNAHLILEEAPAEEPVPTPEVPLVPVVVSARSRASLAGQAGRLAGFVAGDASLAGVARALVTNRAALTERAVMVVGSREEAVTNLEALARGEDPAAVVTGRAGSPGKLVWVFPGQGSQWIGMGRELLDSSPVFAERVAECAAALEPWIDWSLLDVLRGESDLLDRVDVVQPASFAMMVGLAAVWQSVGVRPDAVVGHSQGEIAAACVSGALSLQDAAKVVALRSQAIATRLAGRGGMASVALSEEDATAWLAPWADRVQVAAVNSPASVVIAGEAQALDEVVDALSGQEVRVRRVAVDYGSHTNQVEAIEDLLAETLAGIEAQAPKVPFYSTLIGDWIRDAGIVDGGYWYRNLRNQVGFGPAVAELVRQGHGVFVEVSAHPVLVQPLSELSDDAVVTGSLRREDGGLRRLLTSMAELYVQGVPLDWTAVLPRTGRVDLPKYAFDHRHYWLRPAESATDAASLGQAAADHPLLGAVVELPQSDGLVFTSRLSVRTHPWLADHAVGGVVILPGSGLAELAVRAGDEAGCTALDELIIEAPLVVPAQGAVRVQVALSGPDETGSRTVDLYSQRDGGAGTWTRHATGVLSTAPAQEPEFDFHAWPPADAERIDVETFYTDLAERGYGYGPAFQGLQAVWRRDGDVFAEVALPEDLRKDAGRFGVHPALLDAALQAATAVGGDEPGQPVLAFAWNGLVLHAAGASALRVRLAPSGPDTLSVAAADETGGLVLTMESLVSRPVSAEQLGAAADAGHDAMFRVDWTELPAVPRAELPPWVRIDTADDVAALAEKADAPPVVVWEAAGGDPALAVSSRVLEIMQAWLAAPAFEEARLVVTTRGAVPAGGDHTLTDPAAAAVWGLVRSAQAEHPDRVVLLDTDGEVPLGAVLASGEPQLAVRGTTFFVPRLARATRLSDAPPAFDPDGTVLVSGAGSLGTLVARHLVTRHGVRRVVLASRQGRDAEGAQDLITELTGEGADVSFVACDVSDRDQVAALLAGLPDLTGVVHTAGVFEDGVIEALTPDQLANVYAAKVTAAMHLDELTRDRDLGAFVVFSSVAGVMGGGGQGPYAAANAFLDAAMASRQAAGLPGLSLAWGLWERSSGMAAHLSEVDHARASRNGVLELTRAEGLALFDLGLRMAESLLVPIKLDLAAMRASTVPVLFRGLVRPSRTQARTASTVDRGLAGRLAGLPVAERAAVLVDLVRGQVAVVLGYDGPEAVRPDTAFKDTGFDSLTSVELRNRLREATGLKLPATLVFDYPNPLAVARYLGARLVPDGTANGNGNGNGHSEDDRLRHALAAIAAEDAGEERSIADLGVDDLVQLAFGDE